MSKDILSNINKIPFLLIAIFMVAIKLNGQQDAPWKTIFNGQNLNGWVIVDPPISVNVEDSSMVINMTKHTARHTFVRSVDKYKDFILEFDFKRNKTIDSGILFRGEKAPETGFSGLFGYMAKIDPRPTRMWTGSIFLDFGDSYFWLQTIENNEPARQSEKGENEWNHMRIEAIGKIIKIWVNDVPTVHILDDKYKKGYIAFKCHFMLSGDEEQEKLKMHYKNIKVISKRAKKYSKSTTLPLLDTRDVTERTYFR